MNSVVNGSFMTEKRDKSQERAQYHKNLLDWFFGLKENWHPRPSYFAYKSGSDGQIHWVEQIDGEKYAKIPRDYIRNILVNQSVLVSDPELHLTTRNAGDILIRIESVLQNTTHLQYQWVLIEEPAAYRFQDQDHPSYHVIDFDYMGHPKTFDREIFWRLFYQDLNTYWRGKLEQMVDYDPEKDRSHHFERLLMCLAQLFCDNEPVKAMPYLHGPGNAGKTTFLNDLGSLFGGAYLPNVQWSNLGTDYGIMNLRGKRLVHVDEAPKGEMSDLHKLVTGASAYLQGRQVYRSPEVFKNSSMIWVTSNHPPLLGNDTAAIARYRPIELGPMHYGYLIESAEERVSLMREQLPYMIEAGLSLLQANGCVIPEVAGAERSEMEEEYFESIDSFLCRHFQQNKATYVERGDFVRFCRRMRFDSRKVIERLSAVFPEVCTDERVRSGSRRPRVIKGIGLRNSEELSYLSLIQSYPINPGQ